MPTPTLDLFEHNDISRLEGLVTSTPTGRLRFPCPIRGKKVKWGPEELIRQLWIHHLTSKYEYSESNLRVEYPVAMGSSKKKADIVVMDADRPTTPYMVVEVKSQDVKKGKDQLHSYTNATGAPLAVWSNGNEQEVWNRKDPNIFIPLPDLPKSTETVEDVGKDPWYYNTLVAKEEERRKLSHSKLTSLRDLIEDMETMVWTHFEA